MNHSYMNFLIVKHLFIFVKNLFFENISVSKIFFVEEFLEMLFEIRNLKFR